MVIILLMLSIFSGSGYSIQLNDSLTSNVKAPETSPKLTWYQMFTNIPDDWVNFGKLTFRQDKIPLYLFVGAMTTGLIATDNASWRASDKVYQNNPGIKRYSDAFVTVGDGKSQFGLGAGFAAYGLVFGDRKAMLVGSEIVQAVLASGAVVQVLKHITGRESPFISTRDAGRWDFFPNQITYHKHVPAYDAFPSGHLTTTVATFTVIIENYPDSKWITPITALATAGLGISMVNTGIHWYSDYPLALVLGYTFGKLAAHPGESLASSVGVKSTVITPIVQPNFTGLGLYVSL